MTEETIAAGPNDVTVRGWMPIETAPKDGTEILLALNDGSVVMSSWVENACEYIGYSGFFKECDRYGDNPRFYNPTHWMPLPKAPNAALPGGPHEQKTTKGA